MTRLRIAGLLIVPLFLAACVSTTAVETSNPPPVDAAEDDVESTPPHSTVPADKPAERMPVHLKIAAVGDMMLGTDYPENHLPDDDGVAFLQSVTATLSSADITFGNLEGVLVDGGEPAKKCSNRNACYLFRSPTRYAQHYLNAGFDALSLANNHARDFGEDGRSATMRVLAAAGIAHSGREGDFVTLSVKGLSVSFVAFSVTRNSNLLHDYDLAAEIVARQAASHDLVVVSFHGGAEGQNTTRIPFGEEEYFGEPRGDVVRFARLMIDSGADFVFGHGPHVVRAMERYKDRLIAYSLGNFATYYGISVAGIKGVAPILMVTLDQDGRFVDGQLHSTIQIRPGGPQADDKQEALMLIRDLTRRDFGDSGLVFHDDGRVTAKDRTQVRATAQPEKASHP